MMNGAPYRTLVMSNIASRSAREHGHIRIVNVLVLIPSSGSYTWVGKLLVCKKTLRCLVFTLQKEL